MIALADLDSFNICRRRANPFLPPCFIKRAGNEESQTVVASLGEKEKFMYPALLKCCRWDYGRGGRGSSHRHRENVADVSELYQELA
jgi:hypothetical protein